MAKPVAFSRPAKPKRAGSTSFNFGANTARKPKRETARRSGGGGKGGGS